MNKYINLYQNIHIIKRVLLFISILILPINLFLVWKPEWSYWQGHFIDYWAPKIYVSQVLIWILWGLELLPAVTTRGKQRIRGIFQQIQLSRTHWIVISVSALLIFRQIFTTHPWPAFVWLGILATGPLLLGLYLWRKKPPFLIVALALLTTTTIQAFIGIYQYIQQSSLAPYWFLGEPALSLKDNLAISVFSHAHTILPYGSTPHPNILAAWMLLGIFVLWRVRKQLPRIVPTALAVLFSSVLFLTESYSAWATLIWGVLFLAIWKKIAITQWTKKFMIFMGIGLAILCTIGLLILPLDSIGKTRKLMDIASLERRQTQLSVAFREIPLHPWGTGWNQHTTLYSPLDVAHLQHGFIQPIHNVWVIFVIENGLWTLILLFTFWIVVQKKYSTILLPVLISIPILCLDHYFYTQIQGQYMIVLLSSFLYLEK